MSMPFDRLGLVLILLALQGCGHGLIAAAKDGDTAAVTRKMADGVSANHRIPIVGTPVLMLAAANGHAETVRVLVENGADVNAADRTGWTVLHAAIHGGHEDVVRLLLERGAEWRRPSRWYLPNPMRLAQMLARDSPDREALLRLLKSLAIQFAEDRR